MSDETTTCVLCTSKQYLLLDANVAWDDRTRALLESNQAPNYVDLPSLKSTRNDASHRLKHIDAAINTMEIALEELQKTRSHLALTVENHRIVLHPIRSFPDDILLYIFKLCVTLTLTSLSLPSHNTLAKLDSLNPTCAPWSLSRVSRRWRQLVINAPLLWSHVSLPLCTYEHMNLAFGSLLYRLGLFLLRSANVNLSVSLWGTETLSTKQSEMLLPLLGVTTGRWRYVSLFLITPVVLRHLAGCDFGRLFQLHLPNGCLPQDAMSNIFSCAQNLAALSIGGHTAKLGIQWNNITTYRCTMEGISQLRNLTAIKILSIENSNGKVDVDKELDSLLETINLPACQSLKMIERNPGEKMFIPRLTQLLVVPALETLKLEFAYTRREYPDFHRPCPHLTRLAIRSRPIHREMPSFVTFLRRHDSITHLYLDRNMATSSALGSLALRVGATSVILPRLKSLRLSDVTMQLLDDEVLDVVESRTNNKSSQLEDLTIIGKKPVWAPNAEDEDSAQRWDTLMNGKLKVLFVSANTF